jgi:glycerophosphoryl diester phosphodiesterase
LPAYPRIIAHRCGGVLAAENSLAGLAAAAQIGCRGVEFDTMLSADGVPILMHDDRVDRTTNGHGMVGQLSLAELRRMRLGSEPVPLLSEALADCERLGLWANVELKPPTGAEAELGRVVGELLAAGWNGHGVVSSFADEALMAARRVAPGLSYALLVQAVPDDWLARARRVDAVAVHADAARLSESARQAIADAGLLLACYTVNRRSVADPLVTRGVSIFTDRPDLWLPGEM